MQLDGLCICSDQCNGAGLSKNYSLSCKKSMTHLQSNRYSFILYCTLVEIFIMADTVYLIYSGCQELRLGHEFQTLYFYKWPGGTKSQSNTCCLLVLWREGGREGEKEKERDGQQQWKQQFFFFFLQIVCLGKTSSGLKTWLDEIIKAIFLVFQELVFNLFLH